VTALVERVRRRLVDEGVTRVPDSARVAAALRDEGLLLGDEALLSLVGSLRDELGGLGPLQSLLLDPAVTDVLVNGPDEVWIDRGDGLELADVRFDGSASVLRLAQRLATMAGRRLDEAAPFVDARLADGTRLHAVIPPIAASCSLISLRIPSHRGFRLDDVVAAGTIDEHGAEWLRAIVSARLAFLVSGGTGSGKTTLLSTLLEVVDPVHRILIVEDSAELRPLHPHVVRLEARPANLEGVGVVTLRDLVRQALRMRPDRVVVGEVRGAEVVDLLASMNTGHEGGCGTVHANSPADVPARLEALGLMAGLPRDAVHALIAAGVQCLIHLDRAPRRVSEIHALTTVSGRASTEPALVLRDGRLREAAGIDTLAAQLQAAGVAVPP
jgi:pilus assembly protein CpaF